MKEVVVGRLVTGETVIGEYREESRSLLENVYVLHLQPDQTGTGMNVTMIPYLAPFETEGGSIFSTHIIRYIGASDQLEAEYIRITSGIITNSGLIKMR